MAMRKTLRPTGVTVLAVLCIIAAIAFLLGGAVLIGLGLVIGTYAASQVTSSLATAGFSGLASLGAGTIAAIITAIGAIALILGILYLAVGVGFLGGKRLGLDTRNDCIYHWYCVGRSANRFWSLFQCT